MRHLLFFVCIFFIAVTAESQESKTIQVPPVKTADNVRIQQANTVVTIPTRTVDNAKPQTANTVQTVAVKTTGDVRQSKIDQAGQSVPLRKTDVAGSVQPANIVNLTTEKTSTATTSTKLQPPSSVSSKQAQEKLQKTGAAFKKTD